MRKHILIPIAGTVTGLLVGYYFFQNDLKFSSGKPSSISWFTVSAILGILIAYISYLVSNKLDRLLPWRTQLANRFSIGILVHFTLAYLLFVSFHYLYRFFKSTVLFELSSSILIKFGIVLFILMLVYNIIYFALYSYYSYATLQIQKVEYERKQIDLQLKALKSQLSPHLLFNNLNTISSLAFKNVNVAEKYIRGLAEIYRYALNSYDSKLVFLHEELSIIHAYLLLLKAKYGESLSYNVNIQEELLSTKIPPLTMQMLIENAVKHNVVNEKHKLKIEVYSTKSSISIKNNLTRTPENVDSFNVGFKNIESRYELIYNKEIKIKKDADFIVEIPIIQ